MRMCNTKSFSRVIGPALAEGQGSVEKGGLLARPVSLCVSGSKTTDKVCSGPGRVIRTGVIFCASRRGTENWGLAPGSKDCFIDPGPGPYLDLEQLSRQSFDYSVSEPSSDTASANVKGQCEEGAISSIVLAPKRRL